MSAILAGSRIRERFSRHCAEAKRIIEFAIGEQPSVGGHHRTAKLEDQSEVEIEPETSVCVIDEQGRLVFEGKAKSTPGALRT